MVTMAQRIEELRIERNLSRPALSAALGFPKMAIEKFETGRLTPSQEQQEKLASYFGVSTFYLRGESGDRTQVDDWMNGAFQAEPAEVQSPKRKPKPTPAPSGSDQNTVFGSFLNNQKFRDILHTAILDVLRSPEGQEILAKAVRKELSGRK